jgi:hypothetical protein
MVLAMAAYTAQRSIPHIQDAGFLEFMMLAVLMNVISRVWHSQGGDLTNETTSCPSSTNPKLYSRGYLLTKTDH